MLAKDFSSLVQLFNLAEFEQAEFYLANQKFDKALPILQAMRDTI